MSADYHPTHWEEFKSYTAKMDKIRAENVTEIIPEIGAYL
jgi:hypothetical protein